MQMRFCRRCGAQLKPDAKFCGSCGAPVTPAPVPEPAPEKTEKPKKRERKRSAAAQPKQAWPRRGAGAAILAVFLCIVIFVFAAITVGLLDIRLAVSAGSLTDTLGAVLSFDRLENLPAGALIAEAGDDQSVIEWAVESIEQSYQESDNEIQITPDAARAFLEDSTFLPFLAQELDACIQDICNDTGSSGVTSRELEELLRENAELMGEIMDEELDDDSVDYMVDQIGSTGMLEYLDASRLLENLPGAYYGLRFGLSWWLIGVFAVLTLLFILLLTKCNRWNALRTCGDTGVTLTVLGGILMIGTALSTLLPELWSAMFGQSQLAAILIGAVLSRSLLCSAAILAAGVLLIVIKIVGKGIVVRAAAKAGRV